MTISKHECLAQAKSLVEEGTAKKLRYAALELRLFMECVTYDKLQSMSSQIPGHMVERLMPPQAVRLLLEFDPHQDSDFQIFVGVEEEFGKPAKDMHYVGAHKVIKLTWLRKHYNKIGQQLHVPTATQKKKPVNTETLAEYLKEVIDEMEEVATGNITGGSLGNVARIECQACGQPIICSEHRIATAHKAICHNQSCGAEYFVTKKVGNQFKFELMQTDFICISCKSKNYIQNKDIDIGREFLCADCGEKHIFVTKQWGYKLVDQD